MEENSFFSWVRRWGSRLVSLQIVSDCKMEDWAEEAFQVASVQEAVEESADLVIDDLRLGV